MRKILFTPYWRQGSRHQERVLSVFPLTNALTSSEADVLLSGQLSGMAPPDALQFVGLSDRIAVFRKAAADPQSAIYQRISRSLRRSDGELSSRVLFISFDPVGGAHTVEDLTGARVTGIDLLQTAKRRLLQFAFTQSGGEEIAPAGSHFAKTSSNHSDRFLRVSRVLEEAANANLIAFWLLPFLWSARPGTVVLDTSSIHEVALLACHHLVQMGRLPDLPLVWSHNSHSGVDEIPSELLNESAFLISATTSGGLAKRLSQRGVPPGKIATCFALIPPNESSVGHVVCDLTQDAFGGIGSIASYVADHCPLCKAGSQVIQVEGDQFSLTPAPVEQVRIEARDLDPAAKSALSALAGRGAFRVYRRDAHDSRLVRDVWCDGSVLLTGSYDGKAKSLGKAAKSWAHSVSQAMTLDVTTVVASEYAGSDYLANQSLRAYAGIATTVRGVSSRDLTSLPQEPERASVVIASAVDREDEMVSISRAMRSFQPGGATYYLALFSLFPSPKDREGFVSTLTFGSHGRQTFRFDALFPLDVEVDRSGGAWKIELETLRRLRQWADSTDVDVPEAIDERIDVLERGVAIGLIERAFWTSPSGAVLELRSDFTLLDWSIEHPQVTAADLYVLLSVILNGLRTRAGSRCLRQNAYHRAVLSAKNFDRFSDGILQAAILRAGRPAEFAYANCGEAVSAAMRQLLVDMLANGLDDPKAEALNEFLIAMCGGVLTLASSDLEIFTREVIGRGDPARHGASVFMARALEARLGREVQSTNAPKWSSAAI